MPGPAPFMPPPPPMDHPSSTLSPLLGSLDEPLILRRAPSRLDFCMEDLEETCADSLTYEMDWSCTSCLHIFVGEEHAFMDDIAPSAPPHFLIVKGPKDDPLPATDEHADESTDTPPLFSAPSDPIDQVIIELRAPIPVRPPSVQVQADAQEPLPLPRNSPQRLNYPHHGFSRSALLQQKNLWNSRHGEWAEWQSRMEHAGAQGQESDTHDAYTGLATPQSLVVASPPPYMRNPPSGLERDLAVRPSRKHEQDIHASIYPRVGDISALRDPYSVDIDRSFFRLPLWTLHKALYAFDMQRKSTLLAPFASTYDSSHIHASMSSSTLSSYSLSTSGDDEESDSTLVADDSPVPKSQHPLEPPKSASPSWNHFSGWELSWYAKWELLIGIFQHGHTRSDAPDHPTRLGIHLESHPTPPPPSERIFRYTFGDDGHDNGGDDDEEYGMFSIDSSFSVDFNEECERALAFYNRELRCSEVAL